MATRRRKTFANLLIARFTAVITVRFIANYTFVTFLFVCKIIFFIRLVYFFFLCFASLFLQGRKLFILSDEMFSFSFFSQICVLLTNLDFDYDAISLSITVPLDLFSLLTCQSSYILSISLDFIRSTLFSTLFLFPIFLALISFCLCVKRSDTFFFYSPPLPSYLRFMFKWFTILSFIHSF